MINKAPCLDFLPRLQKVFSPDYTRGVAEECLPSSRGALFYGNQKLFSLLYFADILQSDAVDAFFLHFQLFTVVVNDQKHRRFSPQIPGVFAEECLPSSRRAIKSCSQRYI